MLKPAIHVAAVCLLAGCGGGGAASFSAGPQAPAAAAPPPAANAAPPAPNTPQNLTFTGLLNDVRVANGAGAVAFDSRLAAAAQGHANDMLANNYFSHTGRNGSSAGDRITAAGYRWQTWGENIAQGQQTEAEVMTAWTNSPGHHANNINPNFEDYGLGQAGNGSQRRWVLVLATER